MVTFEFGSMRTRWRFALIILRRYCGQDIETDGGAGGCTPRAGKVGPRSNPGPYFLSVAIGAQRLSGLTNARAPGVFPAVEPLAFSILEIKSCSGGKNTEHTADNFFVCIDECAMTIWRQRLQIFEQHGASKNDKANAHDVSGIGQTKQEPGNRKRDDVFEVRGTRYLGPCLDRRESCVGDES